MKVLITGSNGFLAKNLISHLKTIDEIKLYLFSKDNSLDTLETHLKEVNFIFHLAGVNRPKNKEEFTSGNINLTKYILDILIKYHKKTPLLFSSSIQSELGNEYGESKKKAEKIIQDYSNHTGANIFIYRLPNIFGKWAKPNYNSVIATWCSNIANNKSIEVDDENSKLSLVYIDDVVKSFIKKMFLKNSFNNEEGKFYDLKNIHLKTLKEIKDLLYSFKKNRISLEIPDVGSGFERALYATYLSYLPIDDFSYDLKGHNDHRGSFYEIIKTLNSGQFSVSTTAPGISRGDHYHHTKNEKFLVVKGEALIEYRNIITNEKISYNVNSKNMKIVEMIPGYTHKITNIGNEEMILFLWANECYDENNPDTFQLEV
ncbi:MAG: capsular biosynthesis protein [Flavobacteriaceae bacterium]|nr:capsular biosynthesis protein [Flavobacteriaceae bacterium]